MRRRLFGRRDEPPRFASDIHDARGESRPAQHGDGGTSRNRAGARRRLDMEGIRAGRIGRRIQPLGSRRDRSRSEARGRGNEARHPAFFRLSTCCMGTKRSFPIPLAEAALFDPRLWEGTARVAAIEAASDGITSDIRADARCRARSALGTDRGRAGRRPLVAAKFAEAKIRGFQGESLGPAKLDRRDRQAFLRGRGRHGGTRLRGGRCFRARAARNLPAAVSSRRRRRLRRHHAGIQQRGRRSDDRACRSPARISEAQTRFRRGDPQRLHRHRGIDRNMASRPISSRRRRSR